LIPLSTPLSFRWTLPLTASKKKKGNQKSKETSENKKKQNG
jgi:hypothetical protein